MKIGIDITSVIYDRGVSRYTANLVSALNKEKDARLFLYGSSLREEQTLQKFVQMVKKEKSAIGVQAVIQKNPPSLQNLLWNTLHMNPMKKILPEIDVFHSWDWLQPPDKNLPLVSTIHDLAILKFPETAHPHILEMHQKSWKVLKERNAEIIAVSFATKKDVVELLQIPAAKVHVIHEALPQETVQTTESLSEEKYDEIKKKLDLTHPYLFFVGTREPRKNLLQLIKAWEPLAKEYQLIIAGESGWDETSQAAKLLKNPQLRFLGKVSNQELAVLYGEAEIFVYPSLYEGFGLPILESFYHGTPVVTSNISSMPEIAGNAAELVDPQSVESIRAGIQKILHESVEEQQKRLQRMIIRLQLFSWEKVAEQTLQVYQRAIDQAD